MPETSSDARSGRRRPRGEPSYKVIKRVGERLHNRSLTEMFEECLRLGKETDEATKQAEQYRVKLEKAQVRADAAEYVELSHHGNTYVKAMHDGRLAELQAKIDKEIRTKKTSNVLNGLIRVAHGGDTKKAQEIASRWSRAILYALHRGIEPDDFGEFFKRPGNGINYCADLYKQIQSGNLSGAGALGDQRRETKNKRKSERYAVDDIDPDDGAGEELDLLESDSSASDRSVRHRVRVEKVEVETDSRTRRFLRKHENDPNTIFPLQGQYCDSGILRLIPAEESSGSSH